MYICSKYFCVLNDDALKKCCYHFCVFHSLSFSLLSSVFFLVMSPRTLFGKKTSKHRNPLRCEWICPARVKAPIFPEQRKIHPYEFVCEIAIIYSISPCFVCALKCIWCKNIAFYIETNLFFDVLQFLSMFQPVWSLFSVHFWFHTILFNLTKYYTDGNVIGPLFFLCMF